MEKDFNCLDGVIDYDAALAISPVRGNPFDSENFYPADGEYLNASGIFNRNERARRRKLREKRKSDRQANRNIMARSKAEARTTQAKAGKLAAQSLGKESQSDIELAKALGKSAPEESGKMSKGLKTGLIVGGVLLVGVIGFFIIKKMGKKGAK